MYQKKEKHILQKMSPHLSQLNVATAHRNYFRRNNLRILKLATYKQIEDHYFSVQIGNFLDWKGLPNVHILFCLHKNIKFHWIVMQIKKFLLPIWWYNRDLFPRSNKYNVVFVLNGLMPLVSWWCTNSFHSYWPCKINQSLAYHQ